MGKGYEEKIASIIMTIGGVTYLYPSRTVYYYLYSRLSSIIRYKYCHVSSHMFIQLLENF